MGAGNEPASHEHTLREDAPAPALEIGFLTSTRRTASIVAQTPVLVLKVNATEMHQVSRDCQLRYYKVFTENLIYRLALTSAQLAAASPGACKY